MRPEFQRLLEPIRRSLQLILGRAVVRAIYDDGEIQRLQISLLKGELRDQIDRVQNYGFTSHPQPGAQAIAVFGGNRANGVVIAVDDRRYRLKSLKPGEVALYTDEGDSIVLGRENEIKIITKKFHVSTDQFELNASDTTINTKSLSVSNGDEDLTKILKDWMEEVINATTSTMLGPMKLIGAKLPKIKSSLEKFIKD